MSNTEINRQIVQEGLDRRASHKKQMEASLEAQARKLRFIINDNHAAKSNTHRLQQKAIAEEQARLQEERRAKYEAKMATYRAREKRYCHQFLARAFTPMIIGVVFISLLLRGELNHWVAIPAASFAFAYNTKVLLTYLTR